MKRAVISKDYLFYLTNHDPTHTSLWGCRFEQWLCGTVGPWSFTSLLLLEWRSPEKCSPLFTKGNTQFSHNEICSTQRGFTPLTPSPRSPVANHCSAPFSVRRRRDISSLTPEYSSVRLAGRDFAGAARLSLAYFTVLDSATIRLDLEWEWVWREIVERACRFFFFCPCHNSVRNKEKEPKLFAKVGQARKEREFCTSSQLCICLTCIWSCQREARSAMHDHSIMVDYKEGLHQRNRIDAENFKSNQAWSSEMDVNNA